MEIDDLVLEHPPGRDKWLLEASKKQLRREIDRLETVVAANHYHAQRLREELKRERTAKTLCAARNVELREQLLAAREALSDIPESTEEPNG